MSASVRSSAIDSTHTVDMLAFHKLLGSILSLLVISSGRSVFATPIVEKRVSEADLQNRWDVIFKQVGKHGVQRFCQGILPHAMTTKTAVETYATPVTSIVSAISTDVLTEVKTASYVEERTLTRTVFEIATITPAPARRDISEMFSKYFALLFAEADAWTVAKCRTISSPITDIVTRTTTKLTPSIAATSTSLAVVSVATTSTAMPISTSVHTVHITSTATIFVTAGLQPEPFRPCPTSFSVSAPVARFPGAGFSFQFDLPSELGGGEIMPGPDERDCADACISEPVCAAYFWSHITATCYLKGAGWTSADLHPDMLEASDAAAGIVGKTCAEMKDGLADRLYRFCCDN